jgi:hypothetical protein
MDRANQPQAMRPLSIVAPNARTDSDLNSSGREEPRTSERSRNMTLQTRPCLNLPYILSVGHEASTRAERNAAQQLSPRKRLVHKFEPEVVTHALWAGMAIDVLDPSLELRVRLVSEIAGQKRREWACRPVNGCRKLLSLGYYPVRRCGGWWDGCGVVVVAMGRLMCPLVYAKGHIVREGCGADRALTGGGRNGTAAVAILAFTVVATTARANTTTNTTTVTATTPAHRRAPCAAPRCGPACPGVRLGVGVRAEGDEGRG